MPNDPNEGRYINPDGSPAPHIDPRIQATKESPIMRQREVEDVAPIEDSEPEPILQRLERLERKLERLQKTIGV